MNPGYMTIVVLIAIGILLASGWKNYFLNGMSYKSIIFFTVAWIIGSFIKLKIDVQGLDIQFNGVFIFLLSFSVYLMVRMKSALERLNLITLSLMVCILDYTLREATRLPMEYIAFSLAIAMVVLQKRVDKQLVCLLLGFLCSNILSLLSHHNTRSLSLAEQSFQDLWWLTLLLTRLFTAPYENGVMGFRKWFSVTFEKK